MQGTKHVSVFRLKKFLAGTAIYLWLIFLVVVVLLPIALIIGASLSPTVNIATIGIIPWESVVQRYEGELILDDDGNVMLDEDGEEMRELGEAMRDEDGSVIRENVFSPNFENFTGLFRTRPGFNFPLWYRNTLIIALLSTFFTMLINAFTAFIFARFKFRGQKPLLMSIMIFQMFPSFLALTAIYIIGLNFGLLDSIYFLVVIYVAGSIPTNIWLVRGYLLNIPKTLDEAAYIDGASKMRVFFNVVLPLSTPILAFIGLNAFMGPWFDFILPRMLLESSDSFTVALGLFQLADEGARDFNFPMFAAGALIVAVPIATLQLVFQKYLLTGLTAGANKGE